MSDSSFLDNLTRTENSASINLENSKKYLATKRRITGLCKALSLETKEYKPEKTVESIENYVKTKDKMTRILYSEISNHLFNLDPEQRVIFLTNVERLMIYALGNETISLDAAKIIVKIYDHTQLVNYQIESMNNIFAQRTADAKVDLHKEIKGVEKEYITILGIFASVVLAFVGSPHKLSTSVGLNHAGLTQTNIFPVSTS